MNIFMILDIVMETILIDISCSQARVDHSVETWIALGWPIVVHLLVENPVLLKIEGSNHQQTQNGIDLKTQMFNLLLLHFLKILTTLKMAIALVPAFTENPQQQEVKQGILNVFDVNCSCQNIMKCSAEDHK